MKHMKIDPHSGTEKIAALKLKIRQREHGYEPPLDLGLEYQGTVEWEQDGFTMTARLEQDDEYVSLADDEALGEFSDYAPDKPGEYIKVDPRGSEKYTLDRSGITNAYTYGDFEQYWSNGRTGTVAESRASLSKRGMSKQVAEEWARANARMFYERALKTLEGEIYNVGVVVTAERAGVVLGEDSLWGIESDSGDYFDDVASDCAEEAIAQANYYIDNMILAAHGKPPRDEVEYITGAGKGDGTFVKVYRSGKREEFKSKVPEYQNY